MSTMTTLSQLYREVSQVEARASAAEARATAAEEELKRYQRADVGERVREYAHDHEQDTRDIPRLGIGAIAERMHRQRGELLDIARQQQAEIERLKERLREYEDKTEPQPRVDAAPCPMRQEGLPHVLRRDETWCFYCGENQPFGTPEELPPGAEAPKEEAYRPGLPPESLRAMCAEWEQDESGDILEMRSGSDSYARWKENELRLPGERWFSPSATARWLLRPVGSTWSEVEQRAARLLGEQDAKAGRDRIPLHELQAAVFGDCDGRTRPTLGVSAAYHAGYDGAIEYRDYKAIERAKVPPGLRTFIWEGAPDNQPLWRPSVDDCPIPWSRVGG